jgi:signal peptidase I
MEQHEENFFKEIFKFSLIALLIVLPIRFFVAQPFIVSGASMQPTFENGQYLIVDQLSYRFEDPQRGSVVIFHYPQDPSKFFIKRIIGLPGETVVIEGTQITIKNDALPGGFVLDEPYVAEANLKNDNLTVTVSEGEYFVLGDNRKASSDSRVWGALPEDLIVGRPFLRLFPISEADILPD